MEFAIQPQLNRFVVPQAGCNAVEAAQMIATQSALRIQAKQQQALAFQQATRQRVAAVAAKQRAAAAAKTEVLKERVQSALQPRPSWEMQLALAAQAAAEAANQVTPLQAETAKVQCQCPVVFSTPKLASPRPSYHREEFVQLEMAARTASNALLSRADPSQLCWNQALVRGTEDSSDTGAGEKVLIVEPQQPVAPVWPDKAGPFWSRGLPTYLSRAEEAEMNFALRKYAMQEERYRAREIAREHPVQQHKR